MSDSHWRGHQQLEFTGLVPFANLRERIKRFRRHLVDGAPHDVAADPARIIKFMLIYDDLIRGRLADASNHQR